MLSVGAAAPRFALRDQDGREHDLDGMLAGGRLLLVFFPFAFTGVCTGELQALDGETSRLAAAGVAVRAVSCDPMASLRAFADRERLSLALLSDFWPHGATASAYGVFDDRLGAATRGTFLVGADRVVVWSDSSGLGEPRDMAAAVRAAAG